MLSEARRGEPQSKHPYLIRDFRCDRDASTRARAARRGSHLLIMTASLGCEQGGHVFLNLRRRLCYRPQPAVQSERMKLRELFGKKTKNEHRIIQRVERTGDV